MLAGMRSYGQYCAIAKALDVVGDRWSLLIVRELWYRGPSRFTDLRGGLPGIATNLLTTRLQDLERGEVLVRVSAQPPAPASTVLYSLTDRGRELHSVLTSLASFGAPLARRYDEGEHFRHHWLHMPVMAYLRDHDPNGPRKCLRVGTAEDGLDVLVCAGDLSVSIADASVTPDAQMTGPPDTLVALINGRHTLAEARDRGLEVSGESSLLGRIWGASEGPAGAGGRGGSTEPQTAGVSK